MTTKTRAELLAAKEEIERQLEAMPEHEWKVGDRVCCVGTVKSIYAGEDYIDIEFDSDGDDIATIDHTALIPAADLIPRAEHERLIAEAKVDTPESYLVMPHAPKIHAGTAVAHLVTEYAKDWDFKGSEFEPRIYTRDVGTVKYSVVVTRTCDAPIKAYISPELDELLNRSIPDHTPADELKCGIGAVLGKWPGNETDEEIQQTLAEVDAPVTAPDAEPVGYANFYYEEVADDLWKTKVLAESHACINASDVAIPLYRHRAPATPAEPVAVASQSVVDEIKNVAIKMATLGFTQWTDELNAALAKITPLPEPDKFWLGKMRKSTELPCVMINNVVSLPIGVGISDIPGFCAALIAKGSETEATL